jgi:hypothetical protein
MPIKDPAGLRLQNHKPVDGTPCKTSRRKPFVSPDTPDRQGSSGRPFGTKKVTAFLSHRQIARIPYLFAPPGNNGRVVFLKA